MCARFFTDEESVRVAVRQAKTENPEVWTVPHGDHFPGTKTVVIAGYKNELHAGLMTWGLPRWDNKGLIINTRSETAFEKKMFQESIQKRRCVIPARGFYEWDAEKKLVSFTGSDHGVIYLAGLFSIENGIHRYSVLTTEPNESVAPFHDRMPVLLEKDAIEEWVFDLSAAEKLMKKEMPLLRSSGSIV